MTREAFENAIIVNSAIGGSTNAPIHINAIARHIGVELSTDDWQEIGHKVPLLVNLQPAGKYLGEEYHRAGGVPAVVAELMKKKLIREKALTANGKTMGDNCRKSPETITLSVAKPAALYNAGGINIDASSMITEVNESKVCGDKNNFVAVTPTIFASAIIFRCIFSISRRSSLIELRRSVSSPSFKSMLFFAASRSSPWVKASAASLA
jgi:dihydroxyacid dehydratase/phosphogluconate dehydratase